MKNNSSNDSSPAVSSKPKSRQVSSRFMSKSLSGPLEPGSTSSSPRRSFVTLTGQISREKEDHHHHRQNQKPTNTTPPPTTTPVLRKQRSCREFNNSEYNPRENDRTIIGGSGRFTFPGKSSSSEKKSSFRNSSDSGTMFSSDDSLKTRKVITQKPLSRTNLSLDSPLTRHMNSKSQWALSPSRSGSPPMLVESKGKPLSFSNSRPSTKGIERILNKGFDLFRSRKSPSASSEATHQLRLLDNRLLQWRFANARANVVNDSISRQAESTLTCASDGLTKLRLSVVQKRIQLERERLEIKLNMVLFSQMKLLQTWEGMERQHMAAIDKMKESLYSAACKVPLIEGAKGDIHSMSIAQKHAFVEVDSIKSALSSFSHMADDTAELLSKLAKVVAQEKSLLQEFNDIFPAICALELEERSLRCGLIQLQS